MDIISITSVSEFLKTRTGIAFIIFSVISIASYLVMTFTRTAKLINKFPQSRKYPIVGSILSVFGTPQHFPNKLREYQKRYGRCVAVWVLHKPLVLISEAEPTQVFLSSSKYIEKASYYKELKWFFGNGLVLSQGKIWKKDRKLFNPLFHNHNFDGFLNSFNHYAKDLVSILKVTFANGNEEKDLHTEISLCTLKIIIYLTSGDCKCLNGETFEKLVKVARMIQTYAEIMLSKPWLALKIVKAFTKLPAMEKELLQLLDDVVNEVIAEKKQLRLNKDYKESSPFLDILLKEKPEEEIKFHISTMIGAGFDTTSTAIKFSLFTFANNLKHQAKIHQELDDVFGSDRNRDVTMDDLNKLKYLELCIKEVLRLYPPAPLIARCATEDVDLGNGYVIPKGCDVGFLIIDLHRDPRVFPNPEKFQPERWLSENCKENMNPYAYIPFSMGPRNCIGQKYATMELKTILAHILRHFTVTSSKSHQDLKLTYSIVLTSIGGIPLKLIKRPI